MPDNRTLAEQREKPRRLWFQFRLRTLLIALAVVGAACSYFARQAKIVRDRRDVLSWLDTRCTYVPFEGDPSVIAAEGIFPWKTALDDSQLTLLRRILGDHFVKEVRYGADAMPDELEKIRTNFPEAEVVAITIP